jgi:hypothetical protein
MNDERGGDQRTGCPFCAFFEQFRDAEVHVLNAKKEILMAIRAIVDREIEVTARSIQKKDSGPRAERVEID